MKVLAERDRNGLLAGICQPGRTRKVASKNFITLCFCCIAAWLAVWGWADVQYVGVNLAGAEFGQTHLPGVFGTDYTYPTQTEVDYFKGRGMNIIRLPFRWERLQQSMNANFDSAESNRFSAFISQTTAKDMYVIVDPHNFARYYPDPANFQSSTQGLIGTAVPSSAFSNFWYRLAQMFKGNHHVVFNLMNEPNTMPTEQWALAANEAIAAIRNAGAANLILVPGNGWTGAWTWSTNYYGTPNAQVMLAIVDPMNHFAYDVHQYVDEDGSGSTTNIANGDPMTGATRLAGFTQWCRDNNRKGFLGEFGVANATIGAGIGDETISNMLAHIRSNADVWLGWTWWAGGPWWDSSMIFLLDKQLDGSDRPAMPVLRNFFPLPTPSLEVVNGNQFRFPTWPGFLYQPQSSTNLTSGVWTNYGSEISGSGQTNAINMSFGSGPAQFYRVRIRLGP